MAAPEQIKSQPDLWSKFKPEQAELQFPTDDGKAPIAAISYTDDFKQAMDYFRGVLKREEVSQRAFDLTTQVLDINPGNYTAWHWRRRCIEKLDLPITKELAWLDEIGPDNEKCYQYWHHRRLMVEALGKPYENEDDFFRDIMQSDSKNYHAWTYRQWYLEHYRLKTPPQHIQDAQLLNNSFWTHRYFLAAGVIDEAETPQARKAAIVAEINYALEGIARRADNEAAWAYLKGFLKAEKQANARLDKRAILYSEAPEILETKLREMPENRFALLALSELLREAKKGEESGAILQKLAEIDPIRKNFYLWKKGRQQS